MQTLKKFQKGNALVFALGITVLVVALATQLLSSLKKEMAYFDTMRAMIHKNHAALSAAILSQTRLSAEMPDFSDYSFQSNGFEVETHLQSLSGLFNINTLTQNSPSLDSEPMLIFNRLLNQLEISNAENIRNSIKMSLPASWISEIKPVFRESENDYFKLLPWVQASDVDNTHLDMNAISEPILSVLFDIDLPIAEALLKQRPFSDMDDFKIILNSFKISPSSTFLENWIGFETNQVLLVTKIKANPPIEMYTLLTKTKSGWTANYQSIGVRP